MLRTLLPLGNESSGLDVARPWDGPCLVDRLGSAASIGPFAPGASEQRALATSAPLITPRLICMVAVARSGTNHLGSVLSRIPELDIRHEIFHKTRCQTMHPHELAELSHRSRKAFPLSCESPAAVSAIRARPGLVMDCLTDLMPPEKRLLYFKVFRLQLSVRQVRSALLRRPDTVVIFLRRRPIDTFISLRKALHVRHWADHDTTKLRINIDANDFIGWWGRTSAWFRKVEAACWALNKPFHRLRYEDDVDVPAEKTFDRFREILASNGVTGLTIAADRQVRDHKRQDRNKELSERVANWPEFQQRLSDKGFLEKAFLPFPHYEPTAWDRILHRLSA